MVFRMVWKPEQISLQFCHNSRVWRTETDGQTKIFSSLDRVCIPCSAVIKQNTAALRSMKSVSLQWSRFASVHYIAVSQCCLCINIIVLFFIAWTVLIVIYCDFLCNCENRSKIGEFAPTRSLWLKISGRRGRPPPITFAPLIVRPMNALQLCRWQFSHKETL